MVDVGLDYLTLDRSSATLSGGEAPAHPAGHPDRLAAWRGVLYVLDEPRIGLHQRDNERLLETLKRLRDLGNTVHRGRARRGDHPSRRLDHRHGPRAPACTAASDRGEGRRRDHRGATERRSPATTCRARSRSRCPAQRRPGNGKRCRGAGRARQQPARHRRGLPPGQLICVTGVSGSGKSTLVNDTLYRALAQRAVRRQGPSPAPLRAHRGPRAHRQGHRHRPEPHRPHAALQSGDLHRAVRRSSATCSPALPESRARGYKPGRFSFNVKGGRCEACQGDGIIRIEMHFLPDVYVPCEACHGQRYNRETLEVHYKGKSIADVLEMTVDEARRVLRAPSRRSSASSDAARRGPRLHPARASAPPRSPAARPSASSCRGSCRSRATGRTLYILDEPTTGLHFADVEKLLEVLHRAGGRRQHGGGHRAQSGRHQDRRLGYRPGTEGGRGGLVLGIGTPRRSLACRLTGDYSGACLAWPPDGGEPPVAGSSSAPRPVGFRRVGASVTGTFAGTRVGKRA